MIHAVHCGILHCTDGLWDGNELKWNGICVFDW